MALRVRKVPVPGARFSKAPETFRAHKAIFHSSVCKNGEVYTPETSCMKGTSLHIKKMRIKQLCKREVRDFALALRDRKISRGLSRNGPLIPGDQEEAELHE